MRRSSCPSVIKSGGVGGGSGTPAPAARPSRSAANDGPVVVRESMCELVYSKDALTESMLGKLKQAFKLPVQDPSKVQMFNPDLRRKSLGFSKKPGTWTPAPYSAPALIPPSAGDGVPAEDEYTYEELVLWTPPPVDAPAGAVVGEAETSTAGAADADGAEVSRAAASAPTAPVAPSATTISVDGFLCRWLREHQREGVQFLFDCCMGLRDYEGEGCILADDMGLGKTLQSITILWTLMTQGRAGAPEVTHTIVTCPVSLVTNWESELNTKWIKEARLRAKGIQIIAVAEAKKEDVVKMIRRFTTCRSAVLIISYETFRIHQKHFKKGAQCGLLICDEAHRLKNKETKTAIALAALPTRKRILLSGTPIQNALDEFYSMVHFANPELLGSERDFCREYQRPILRGREPDATDKEREKGEAKSAELGKIVNQFILRRTNTLLSKHLPPKLVCVVCCSMSALQLQMYRQFLSSKVARQAVNGGKQSMVLESINSLRKLVNHPSLVYDNGKASKGFEEAVHLLPEETVSGRRHGGQAIFHPSLGGKMMVLHQLLRYVKATSSDRFVLVSNFTQTLDLFERMCDQEGWKSCKLDGSCSIKKRTAMVEEFNDPKSGLFCFLLSSKAGGCGLNLIGGNRLVLFDPDWNPANDKQAAARVWRDGQKKRVYLYRMLAAACIEEKVFERQLSKEGLAGIATNDQVEASTFSSAQLRDLFSLHEGMPSHLYDKIRHAAEEAEWAEDGPANSLDEPSSSQETPLRRQNGWPKETGDMHLWAHHATAASVDDEALRRAVRHSTPESGSVSFVFSLHVQGKDLKKAREEEEEDRRREAAEMAELREREKKHASELAAASAQAGADGKENSQPARPVPGPVAAPLPLGKRALAGGRGMPFRAVLPPAKFGPAAGQHGKGAGAAARTGAKPKGKAGRDVSDSEEEASDESVAESEESESDVEESESEAGSEVEVEEESRGGAGPMDGAGMLGCASGDVAGGCAAAPVPSAPKPRPSKRLVIESDEEDSEGPSDGPQAGPLPPPPLQPPEPPRHTPAAHVQAAPVPGLGFADGRMPVAARADIGTKADGSGSSNGSSSTFGARKPGSKLSLSRKPQ